MDVFNPGNAVTLVPNERLFLQEVLALRLTQNFQLYQPQALCYFDPGKLKTE